MFSRASDYYIFSIEIISLLLCGCGESYPNNYAFRTGSQNEMSIVETSTALARRSFDRLVTYVREFVLIATFAIISVAVITPTLVAPVGAVFWAITHLGLEGPARAACMGLGVVVTMFTFAMLHRFVQAVARLLLGPTRSPMWQS